MAWGLVTDNQGVRVSTALTLSFNAGATAKLLVVSVWTNGITARTGGAPTYNGVTMTDSGNGFIAYASTGECGVEVFYLIAPYTGGAADIVFPNDNLVSINISASSWSTSNIASKDQTNNTTGTKQNPSLMVAAVLAAPAWAQQAAIKWKAQTLWSAQERPHKTFEDFCKRVKVLTNGRLEIEPYPSAAIVPAVEGLTDLQGNVLQALHTWPGYFSGRNPAFAALCDLIFPTTTPGSWTPSCTTGAGSSCCANSTNPWAFTPWA